MHKFLRSIGFSTYRKKRDIEKLLASLIPSAKWRRIQLDEETNLCELRAEVAPGMGIVMMGEMDEEGAFQCEYYFLHDGLFHSATHGKRSVRRTSR